MKAIALVVLAAACASKAPAVEKPAEAEPKPAAQAAAPAGAEVSPGIDVQGIDRSVQPGDDFFKFANGTWIKNTEIPADRGSYGTGEILLELTAKRTADLIAEVSKDPAAAGG